MAGNNSIQLLRGGPLTPNSSATLLPGQPCVVAPFGLLYVGGAHELNGSAYATTSISVKTSHPINTGASIVIELESKSLRCWIPVFCDHGLSGAASVTNLMSLQKALKPVVYNGQCNNIPCSGILKNKNTPVYGAFSIDSIGGMLSAIYKQSSSSGLETINESITSYSSSVVDLFNIWKP